MISWKQFCSSYPLFVKQMRNIPVNKIKLSEALLTNCIASLNLNTYAFEDDIRIKMRFPFIGKFIFKYKDCKKNLIFKILYFWGPGKHFSVIRPPYQCLTGKQIARHYMSGQKELMLKDANNLLN